MNETISPLALPGFVRQRLFDADAAMARALAAAVADALRSGLARRGCASLAVSGGRSPIPFLEALSAETLDWSRVVVTLVDEGPAPLKEDVTITAFEDCVTVEQWDEREDKVVKVTLSPAQVRDLRAALDLPEGVYRGRPAV